MNIEKTIKSLEKNRFKVTYFEQAEDAAKYLDDAIDGKVVGFGDSITMKSMKLYERLSAHNEVHDPNQSTDNDEFLEIAMKCLDTEIYLTSVNAMSETGEMVNIDGTGNRVAASLFCAIKKYTLSLRPARSKKSLGEGLVWRATEMSPGPKNAMKYNLSRTPCVAKGGDRCYNCGSPDRICNTMNIYMKKMNDIDEVEVVLINDELGF